MSKQSVSLKGEMDLSNVVIHLGDIIKGLEEGTICIQQGVDLLTLKPASNIEMDLEASLKGNKEKISIELSWKQKTEEKSPDQDFKITCTEPEAIEEPSVTSEV